MPDERPLDDCVECGTKDAPKIPSDIFQFCQVIGGRRSKDELEGVAVRDCQPDPYRSKKPTSAGASGRKAKDDCLEKNSGSKTRRASDLT
jgi:hypothetical protein